jgi:hypothetical protein
MCVICFFFFLVKIVDRALEKAAYVSRLRESGPNVVRKGCENFFCFCLRPSFRVLT